VTRTLKECAAVKLNCNDENASQEMTGAALLAEHVDLEQVLEQVRSAFTSQELMNKNSGLMFRVKPQTLNADPKSLVKGQRHGGGGCCCLTTVPLLRAYPSAAAAYRG
jgi:hypothetical protein